MFKLTVNTDNAAFATDETFPDPAPEVARILRQLADRIEAGGETGTILDVNGNTVGSFDLR